MVHNPFITPRKPPKPRRDREYKDGRKYLANKTDLRREVFERSGGTCEAMLAWEMGSWKGFRRCMKPITWEDFHLAHDKHGEGFRNDDLAHCTAKCANCHVEGDHGSKCNYPRRAGKVMTKEKAKAYWQRKVCFCDHAKPSNTSLCDDCLVKLPEALRHDLEHTQGKDYLRVLAECETAILKFNLEAE